MAALRLVRYLLKKLSNLKEINKFYMCFSIQLLKWRIHIGVNQYYLDYGFHCILSSYGRG